MNPPSLHLLPLAVAAAALLSACRQDSPQVLIDSAQTYLTNNDTKAAVIQLKSALQQEPDSSQARFLLGRTFLDTGDAVSAEIELRKAQALNHSQDDVAPALARTLLLSGQSHKLVEQFAGMELSDGAAAADLRTSLATAYLQLGQRQRAETALNGAFERAPDYAPARLVQARLKVQDGDLDGALQMLDRIVAKTPNAHEAWELKGQLLLFRADAPAAREAFAKAVAIRSDYLPAHSGLVTVALANGDSKAAKAQIDELRKTAPNHPQTKLLEAQLALFDKNYELARQLSQQLLRVAPDNARVLQIAGVAELNGGSLLQAESLLSKSLQIAPDVPATRLVLAQTQLRLGDPGKALETLEPLLASENVGPRALALAAQAQVQSGDLASAQKLLARAASADPDDFASRTALALVKLSGGKTQLGYAELQKIAAADTEGTVADLALINAHSREGKYDAALKAVEALEKKTPDTPQVHNLRGRIHLARNDIAAARQSFEKTLSADAADVQAATALAALDLQDQKPDQARKRFDAALKADPTNLRVLMGLAELRARAGADKEEVAGMLREAIRHHPNSAAPRLLLIDQLLRANDKKGALAAAQEGTAALPNSAELVAALASVQLANGDTQQSINSFNRLVDLRPKSAQSYIGLAQAQVTAKDGDAARRSLKRALEISPNLVDAQRGLIRLELATGNAEEALAIAKAAQRAPATEAAGALFVGDIYAFQKNWAAARTAYQASLRSAPNTDAAVKLHAALLAEGNALAAKSHAANWLKNRPEDSMFRLYLGDRALSQQDYVSAEQHYIAALRLQPGNAVALNNLAWVTSRLKKPGGLALAQKANAISPGQPAFMDSLAMLLAEDNQLDKALDLEKKVVALAPDHAPYRLRLARLYLQVGEKAQARLELQRLAKLGDSFGAQAEVAELMQELR